MVKSSEIHVIFFIILSASSITFNKQPLCQEKAHPTALVLPPISKSVDPLLLEVLGSFIVDKLKKSGIDLIDTQCATESQSWCQTETCDRKEDYISAGVKCGVELILITNVEKVESELEITIQLLNVASRKIKIAKANAQNSSLLIESGKLINQLTEQYTKPSPPSPPAQPEAPSPPQSLPRTEMGLSEAGERKLSEKHPSIIPPGAKVKQEAGKKEEKKATAPEKKDQKEKKPVDQSGRVAVVITSSALAMGEGLAIPMAAGVDDWRIYVPTILLGGAAGAVVGFIATAKFKITSGDASMFNAIVGWSIVNGLLIPPASGKTNHTALALGGAIAGGIGLAGAITAISVADPYKGDGVLMSMAGAWGAVYAEMITGLAMPEESSKYFIAGLVGLNLGLVAGAVTSIWVDISPYRCAVTTMIAVAGAGLGAVAGVPFIVKKNPSRKDWRIFDGILLAGTTLGLVTGLFVSSIAEKKRKEKKQNSSNSKKEAEKHSSTLTGPLISKMEDGWSVSIPSIYPISGPDGKITGLHIPIAGGTYR